MEAWQVAIITAISTVLASSGFWTFMSKHSDRHSTTNKILLGLAHDKIIELGMKYIDRGSITHDELENLVDYLYKPYKEMGGNGAAERIVNIVLTLPVTNNPPPTWPEIERRRKCTFEDSKENSNG